MKVKINIKSIIFMAAIALTSLLFINISFATNTGKVISEGARLREQPNTSSEIVEVASKGEEVEILEEADDWYKVKYNKVTGYLRSDLVEVVSKKENALNETKTEEPATEAEPIEEEPAVEEKIEAAEKTIKKGNKYKVTEDVKLKIIPLISSIESNSVTKNSEVEVVEILNDWIKIKTAEENEGWLRKEKLQIENQETNVAENTTNNQEQTAVEETSSETMYVAVQTVNVREKPSTDSEIVKGLELNDSVKVLSTEDGWACIEIDGKKAYILARLLSNQKQDTSRSATTKRENTKTENNTEKEQIEKTSTITNIAQATVATGGTVIDYAKQYLGCKYVYGGTTTKGFDCSGFTQFVYKHFGVSLNRTAAAQYSNGTPVSKENLQAGDLVMFGKGGINHVGIYIGGGTFIHAANPSRGVTTDTMNSGYYYTNYVGARRVM